jgi:hypothetical protein
LTAASLIENIGRAWPTFQYLEEVIAKIRGGREGALDKAVAIWATIHGLSALMLSGQLVAILSKPARAGVEKTVMELIERGRPASINRSRSRSGL